MKSELSEEEKYRVAIQVDRFIEIMEKRSGTTFSEVLSLLEWARERRNTTSKIRMGTLLAIVTAAISLAFFIIFDGLKYFFNKGP